MPNITSTYQTIHDFFYRKEENKNVIKPTIPEQLHGIWSLKSLNEMGLLICLENGEWNQERKQITLPLFKQGTILFKEEHLFTQWMIKTFHAKFQFTFNEDYTRAGIKLKLGKLPLWVPKEIFNWELVCEPENDRMIVRKSKFFGKTESYISTKIQNEMDVVQLGEYENLYFV